MITIWLKGLLICRENCLRVNRNTWWGRHRREIRDESADACSKLQKLCKYFCFIGMFHGCTCKTMHTSRRGTSIYSESSITCCLRISKSGSCVLRVCLHHFAITARESITRSFGRCFLKLSNGTFNFYINNTYNSRPKMQWCGSVISNNNLSKNQKARLILYIDL